MRAGTISCRSVPWRPGAPGSAPCGSTPSRRRRGRRSRRSSRRRTCRWPPARSTASASPPPPPSGSAWNQVIRNGHTAELADAADAFGRLTDEAPEDAEAWYNKGLCLAWLGQDRQAIECLAEAVGLFADRDPNQAADAWALAEILRQGGGAESLSDDLRYRLQLRLERRRHGPAGVGLPRDPTDPDARATPPGRVTRSPTSRSSSGSTARSPPPRRSPARSTCPGSWPRSTSRRGRSG